MGHGPIGRRQALARFGVLGLGALATACRDGGGGSGEADGAAPATASPTPTSVGPPVPPIGADVFGGAAACTLTPEQTEGPYYVDVGSIRNDIREDRAGVLLHLGLRIRDAHSCVPFPNAVVDIWHADADGDYSGFGDAPPGSTFLRGAQVTDTDGIVEFVTIYPGWYPGRTPHIHVKVHLDRSTLLTTQVYFHDGLSEAVYEHEPYSARGPADRTNAQDGIFDDRLVLTTTEELDGYRGLMTLDVAVR